MKTLRLIGSVIMAIMISMNFIACSDDDDDKNPNDKRLIRVEDSEDIQKCINMMGWDVLVNIN